GADHQCGAAGRGAGGAEIAGRAVADRRNPSRVLQLRPTTRNDRARRGVAVVEIDDPPELIRTDAARATQFDVPRAGVVDEQPRARCLGAALAVASEPAPFDVRRERHPAPDAAERAPL